MAEAFRVQTASGWSTFAAASGAYALPHEHLLLDLSPWWSGEEPFGSIVDDEGLSSATIGDARRDPLGTVRENLILSDWVALARELRVAAAAGLRVVVDLTSEGLEPQRSAALRAALNAGVELVIGVGHYREPNFSAQARRESAEQRSERWLNTWEHGFEDGTYPGIIGEIGTSPVITPDEHKSLVAASMVSNQTGAAISIHVDPFSGIEMQIASILLGEGVQPSRIVLGHLDSDFAEHRLRELVELGVYIEFDQFGAPPEVVERGRSMPEDLERIRMIESLVQWGAEDRILLSHDVCTRNQWLCWGGGGFAYIGTHVRPQLVRALGQDIADKLLWGNPMSALSIVGTDDER